MLNMSGGIGIVTALAMVGSGLVVASHIDRYEYALIDGPQYALVTHTEFEEVRTTCRTIVTKRYPSLHLVQEQCER